MYNVIFDSPIVTSNDEERTSLPTESAKNMKKTDEILQPDNKEAVSFTRYVLNTKENPIQDSEEDLNPILNASYKTHKNSDLNKAYDGPFNNITDKQLRQYLDKSLK